MFVGHFITASASNRAIAPAKAWQPPGARYLNAWAVQAGFVWKSHPCCLGLSARALTFLT